MDIRAETGVSELLAAHPFLLEFLAAYDSKFSALRNPVMRATMGRMATLKTAAAIAGVPLGRLIEDIRAEIARHDDASVTSPTVTFTGGVRADKIAGLKTIIADLHRGADFTEVKRRFDQLVTDVSPSEIARMEEELIREGLPVEEVQRLCDVHVSVFKGPLEETDLPPLPAGHPVDTYVVENRVLTDLANRLGSLAGRSVEKPFPWGELDELLQKLSGLDNHYVRKENQLFPYLERHGVTGPSKVMWGVHDEVRRMMNDIRSARESEDSSTLAEQIPALSRTIVEMVYKENKILLPMALEKLDKSEWEEIRRGEDELGYALVSPPPPWPRTSEILTDTSQEVEVSGLLKLNTGQLTLEQIDLLLTHLPVEVSFVDENDEVRYYSGTKERIFPRSPGVIGRTVQNCHPAKSVHMVNRILEEFRAGSKDVAEFWIEMRGRFLHIRYFAVRDSEGDYRGTLEVTQDVTGIRELEGERRLLDWV